MSASRVFLGITGAAVVIVAAVCLQPSIAWAEEGEFDRAALTAAIAERVGAIREHRENDDIYELAEDVWALVRLHARASKLEGSRKQTGTIVDMVGRLTHYRDERIRPIALRALGVMGDPRGLRHVKPFLRPSRCSEINETTIAAIESASLLKGESCVYNLIGILRRSECPCEVIEAVQALQDLGDCARHRKRVLEVLTERLAKSRAEVLPANPPEAPIDSEQQVISVIPQDFPALRAERLQSSLTEALKELWLGYTHAGVKDGRYGEAALGLAKAAELGDFPPRPRAGGLPPCVTPEAFEAAVAKLEKHRAAHPDDTDAHLVAAYLYVSLLADPEKACQAVGQVLLLRPADPTATALQQVLRPQPEAPEETENEDDAPSGAEAESEGDEGP